MCKALSEIPFLTMARLPASSLSLANSSKAVTNVQPQIDVEQLTFLVISFWKCAYTKNVVFKNRHSKTEKNEKEKKNKYNRT